MSKGAVIVGTDQKGLAEQIRLKTTALIKELEAKEDEACHLHRLAEDAEDAAAEYETRLYSHAVQELLSDVHDASSRLKYWLGNIDADGELYHYQSRERWRLPTTDGRSDNYVEFTCGMLIEVWDTTERCHNLSNGEWNCDRVECSDSYGGYYRYYAPLTILLTCLTVVREYRKIG
jgi:hypothetical protein